MKFEYTGYGEDRFPELEWRAPASIASQVEEFLLIYEDPDALFLWPPTHGLHYAIPLSTTHITVYDMTLDKDNTAGRTKMVVKGPFKVSKNIMGTYYGGPRPLLGHRPYRYFYKLVTLKEPLDVTKLSEIVTKKELTDTIIGKVIR